VAREGANATPRDAFRLRNSPRRGPVAQARRGPAGLYGRLDRADSRADSENSIDDKGESQCVGPNHSGVACRLAGVKLTYLQRANRMKLGRLVIGPFTDE
jgi:hypothetical protein